MRSKLLRFFPALSLLVLVSAPLRAQAAQPEIDLRQHYVKSERMIPTAPTTSTGSGKICSAT